MTAFTKSIKETDKALARYYASQGRKDYIDSDGNGKFQAACDENGFGEDDLVSEMDQSPEDCMLLEFDPDFPGVTAEDLDAVYAIVKNCYENGPNAIFGKKTKPKKTIKYDKQMFEISNKDKARITKLYKSQCPKLFLSTILKDEATFKLMMVGSKLETPYIQYLVDDFLRWRVESFAPNQKLDVSEWCKDNKHLRAIQHASKVNYDSVVAAVKGFSTRICPVLQFQPISKIRGDLEETAEAIFAAISFVAALSHQSESCPFQMDFVIGFDTVKNEIDTGDDDSDDDDEQEVTEDNNALKMGEVLDIIGDVQSKVKNNGLLWYEQNEAKESDSEQKSSEKKGVRNLINNCYQGFIRESKEDLLGFSKHKRFIGFADKRGMNKDAPLNKMVMFSPPSDCSAIPKNAVNEWYFSSTSTCLIPNAGYKVQKMMCDDDMKGQSVSANSGQSTLEKMKNANIGCKDQASMITLSFHVKEEESIACYLYAMGQYTRFMAEDIMNVLPLLFEESEENKLFKAIEEIKISVDEMEKLLVDHDFNAFRTQCR